MQRLFTVREIGKSRFTVRQIARNIIHETTPGKSLRIIYRRVLYIFDGHATV